MNRKKSYSIKKHLMVSFGVILTCVLIVHWLVNVCFLEYFYITKQVGELYSLYEELNSFDYNEYMYAVYAGDVEKYKQFKAKLGEICRINNIDFIVTDDASNVIMTSIYESKHANKYLQDTIFAKDEALIKKVLDNNDCYTICLMRDNEENADYTAMWGYLDNGDYFMLRTSLDSVKNSVAVANIFALYVGIGSILVGTIFVIFVSSKITKPIAELTELSRRMANLDFDAKYNSSYSNEINILGENYNIMSKKLHDTIDELKRDVEHKTRMEKVRKEFVANVSHELKTPIALISGYAEGLKEGVSENPEDIDFYCDVIIDETKKMNKLVRQLINLDLYEEGVIEPEVKSINISSFAHDYLQSSKVLTKDKAVNLLIDDRAKNVVVSADEYQLEEVFNNFYSNALNHLDEKGIIKMTLETIDNKVYVRIYNSGELIPEEALEYLWDKFYKVDKARTREYGGSGIGLSIVKAILDNFNGQYGVENKIDGVEFWFSLEISGRLPV